EDGGAEKAMKGLSAAAEKCTGGFKTTTSGEKLEIAKVATTAAPKGGDESAAITLTLAAEGGVEAPNKVVAVRKGSTVVTFTVVNRAALADGKGFEVPADVVDAQVCKLGCRACRGGEAGARPRPPRPPRRAAPPSRCARPPGPTPGR